MREKNYRIYFVRNCSIYGAEVTDVQNFGPGCTSSKGKFRRETFMDCNVNVPTNDHGENSRRQVCHSVHYMGILCQYR